MPSAARLSTSLRQKLTPSIRQEIQKVRFDVFGHAPNLEHRTGHKRARKTLKGVYLNQYYLDRIDTVARKYIPGFMTEDQERKAQKLGQMQRRGKGPPKKGSGSSKK